MSLHFDVVIMCDLRVDMPDEAIEALRGLTNRDYELKMTPKLLIEEDDIWSMFSDYHFLAPVLENETVSSFHRFLREIDTAKNREIYRWSLQFSGRQILDDIYHTHHLPFLYWLASAVYEKANQGFIGYIKETFDAPSMMYVKNGKLVTDRYTYVDSE